MRRAAWIGTGLLVVGALLGGLAWFQPWKLWTDHRVDDTLPAVAIESPVADVTPPPGPTSARPAPTTPVATPSRAARVLSRGTLISHEHATRGRVTVVQQPDGSRVLAIADLDTSDGPDVQVWLTDAPVRRGESGWYVFDDGAHVSLGTLKGNLGNQVYRIPRSADLAQLTSISLWCARFDVSFGAAQLVPVS